MSNKDSKNSMLEELKKLRNTWPDGVNPVTKVIPDKKKEYRNGKRKYKGNDEER